MTTDITELAQSMKAAAHKAKQANDLYLEGKITLSECVVETKDYLDYSDNPNNFLALVEALEKSELRLHEVAVACATAEQALEKAQQGEKQWREVVDAFCADDAEWHKLTNSTNELISLLSQSLCKQADRIAELESRLNSADKLQDSAFRSGLQHGFSLGQTDDQKGYEQSMAAYSPDAAIKWESA